MGFFSYDQPDDDANKLSKEDQLLKYARQTANNTSTIKNILLFYLFVSILTGLYLAFK